MRWKKRLMDEGEINRAVNRMAHEIIERSASLKDVVLVGVHTRGIPLAEHLSKLIHHYEGLEVPVGKLDITLYRDDLTEIGVQPIVRRTEVPVDIHGRELVLCDDVIYTGRTVRAALDALMDLGRPSLIRLAVLVDRGHRELPIQADYVGRAIQTSRSEVIKVHFHSTDGEEGVDLLESES
ncbi:MAG: bifunctional pyr operon transcriptional regulator/uracil phosphoribosyltransferase PyrR [Myxococcales bacterium]|nr:bifunctional pyr operon transcriptional regulator/uracil phosphoribosyltransferase PyrR [Myxococcales bacterium]MCB9642514.1 bifunctional pyr operon transcriptional regulator/uracil phosphoribosyltransferase PyrR [Myxococcales bacterium]